MSRARSPARGGARSATPERRTFAVPNYSEHDEGLLAKLAEVDKAYREAEAELAAVRGRVASVEHQEQHVRSYLNSAGIRRRRADAQRQQREQAAVELRGRTEEGRRERRLRESGRDKERERKEGVRVMLESLYVDRKGRVARLRDALKEGDDLRQSIRSRTLEDNKKTHADARNSVAAQRQARDEARQERLQRVNDARAAQRRAAQAALRERRDAQHGELRQRNRDAREARQETILRASAACLMEKRRAVVREYEERESARLADRAELARRVADLQRDEAAVAERLARFAKAHPELASPPRSRGGAAAAAP